jgi:hypothetical protein
MIATEAKPTSIETRKDCVRTMVLKIFIIGLMKKWSVEKNFTTEYYLISGRFCPILRRMLEARYVWLSFSMPTNDAATRLKN